MLVSEHISRGAELPVTSRHDAVTRVASPVAEAATVRFTRRYGFTINPKKE